MPNATFADHARCVCFDKTVFIWAAGFFFVLFFKNVMCIVYIRLGNVLYARCLLSVCEYQYVNINHLQAFVVLKKGINHDRAGCYAENNQQWGVWCNRKGSRGLLPTQSRWFSVCLFFAEHPKMFYSSYHSDLPMITICNLLMNNKSNFSYI